jgi:ABC-2 type transport system permease protein
MSTQAFPQTPRQRRAFGMLMSTEIKLTMRRPRGLIVALGVPFALLVIFGSIPSMTRPSAALGGISFFNLYVPTLLLFVLIAVGLVVLPQQLATYRQQGVLRRMSTTPVPPSWLLAAQMTVTLGMAALGILVLLGAGAGAYGLVLPHSAGGYLVFLLALVLTAAATLGLGLCVAAVVSSPQVAAGVAGVLFYLLAFFSGLYVPLQELHSQLITTISKILPTGVGFTAVHDAFMGHFPGAEPLLVLAAWAVGCCMLAARLFRWE